MALAVENMEEEDNTGQQHDINEKLLLDLAWERQQKKVRRNAEHALHLPHLLLLCIPIKRASLLSFKSPLLPFVHKSNNKVYYIQSLSLSLSLHTCLLYIDFHCMVQLAFKEGWHSNQRDRARPQRWYGPPSAP